MKKNHMGHFIVPDMGQCHKGIYEAHSLNFSNHVYPLPWYASKKYSIDLQIRRTREHMIEVNQYWKPPAKSPRKDGLSPLIG